MAVKMPTFLYRSYSEVPFVPWKPTNLPHTIRSTRLQHQNTNKNKNKGLSGKRMEKKHTYYLFCQLCEREARFRNVSLQDICTNGKQVKSLYALTAQFLQMHVILNDLLSRSDWTAATNYM